MTTPSLGTRIPEEILKGLRPERGPDESFVEYKRRRSLVNNFVKLFLKTRFNVQVRWNSLEHGTYFKDQESPLAIRSARQHRQKVVMMLGDHYERLAAQK